jgi:hypothetical protein
MGKRKFLTLPGLELRPLSHPARNQSLFRLRLHLQGGTVTKPGKRKEERASCLFLANWLLSLFFEVDILPKRR